MKSFQNVKCWILRLLAFKVHTQILEVLLTRLTYICARVLSMRSTNLFLSVYECSWTFKLKQQVQRFCDKVY